jgi:hypothetical protein
MSTGDRYSIAIRKWRLAIRSAPSLAQCLILQDGADGCIADAPRSSNPDTLLAPTKKNSRDQIDWSRLSSTPYGVICRAQARSKRSAFMTLVQAATKSLTNLSLLSSWA